MFRFVSAAAAAVLVAALSGCASLFGGGCLPSGSASNSVQVTGDFGADPTVTFDKGLVLSETQRTEVIPGDGQQVADGDNVSILYTIYNGTTGLKMDQSYYKDGGEISWPVDVTVSDVNQLIGLSKALVCSKVGSRFVAVVPNSEGFGADAASAGIGVDDVLVLVIDVVSISAKPLDTATGTPVDPQAGFPDVAFTDGNPTVTIPAGEVPTEFALETLIQGDGAVVGDGNTVVVNYEGVNWNTGEVFDSSFDRGEPATFNTSGVIAGFKQALVGQKVGSRVVVIIPSDLGYGDAGSGDAIKGGDTLVFVVDILGIQ